jgi:predicted ATPase
LEEVFLKKITEAEGNLTGLKKIHSIYGNLKLAFFGLAVYLSASGRFALASLAAAGLAILFVLQYKKSEKINYNNEIVNINKRYLDRISGAWRDFKTPREISNQPENSYAADLDIIGRNSLFQLINTTSSFLGRRKLIDKLLNYPRDEKEILENKEAVKELAANIKFCQDLEYMKANDSESVLETIDYLSKEAVFIKNRFLAETVKYLPFATIGAFAFKFFIPGVVLLFLHAVIWACGFLSILKYLSGFSHHSHKFGDYKKIFKHMEKADFKSVKLSRLKKRLFGPALTALREIDIIDQKLSLRRSFPLFFVLNLLFLWDYGCCAALSDWRKKYSGQAAGWFDDLAEIEALASFAVMENILEKKCYASIGKKLTGRQIGHPMINQNVRVYNDAEIDGEILIISGSNMSGKTTFLRTVGVNLILAYNGAAVCAEAFQTPVFDLQSSMRTTDDLSEGISTFYAELLKIKNILSRASEKTLFLIDEIFKGTNSKDRIFGARTVIKKLRSLGAQGMITTHDLEICEPENVPKITNYHFREKYADGKIFFDYKLIKGFSEATNGAELMKLVGIMEV